MPVKDTIVVLFTGAFYYGVLPALTLWCGLTIWILCTYIIKGLLFLVTGAASIVGATGPAALSPAFSESMFGALLSITVVGVSLLYRYLKLEYNYAHQYHVAQEDVPLTEMIPGE
jgi:hypothetical protein